jgi:hypothetical protein
VEAWTPHDTPPSSPQPVTNFRPYLCAESWNDIALYGRSKLTWLRTFLELPNGIPSHDTFRRVFMLIDPEAFEACFTAWAASLAAGFEREVVAIVNAREKMHRRVGVKMHRGACGQGHVERHVSI